DLPSLHRGGVVRVDERRDVRESQPRRHARHRRALPAGQRGRRRHGHPRRGHGRRDVAPHARPDTPRGPVSPRRPARRAHGEGRGMFGDTVPSELPDKWAMSIRQPLGVAGIITPWNFPIAIPCWKMMPALVTGNTVVFKPSSDTPYCATLLVELMAEAGFPP